MNWSQVPEKLQGAVVDRVCPDRSDCLRVGAWLRRESERYRRGDDVRPASYFAGAAHRYLTKLEARYAAMDRLGWRAEQISTLLDDLRVRVDALRERVRVEKARRG